MSPKSVPLAIISQDLSIIPALADHFLDHPWISGNDFGVGAPLYKATPSLKEMHQNTRSPRDRLRNYLTQGVLNEEVRVQVAEQFAKTYRQRFGQGERHDIFIASGEILRLKAQLKSLRAFSANEFAEISQWINANAHDSSILAAESPSAPAFGAGGIPEDDPFFDDPSRLLRDELGDPYSVELKIFLDNPYNPWRRKDGAVHQILETKDWTDPVVTEIWAAPALLGYPFAMAKDLADEIGAEVALLESEIRLR